MASAPRKAQDATATPLAGDAARQLDWLRGALRSAMAGTYLLSAIRDASGAVVDFRIEFSNAEGARLLRTTLEAMEGQPVSGFLPPERMEPVLRSCREVMASGEPRQEEFEVESYDASMRWLRHQIVPIADGVAITSENISERKHLELRLREREAIATGFMRHMPGHAWVNDLQGRMKLWNAAQAALIPEQAPEAGGDAPEPTLWDMFPPALADRYHAQNRDVAAKGEAVVSIEAGADGLHAFYEVRKFPIDAEGLPPLVGGIALDVSEREHRLSAAEQLAAIVNASGDAIVSCDTRGVILSWNAAAEHLFGWSASEAVGRHASMLWPDDLATEAQDGLRRVSAGDGTTHVETRCQRRDGEMVNVLASHAPLRDGQGNVVATANVFTDIGEQKRQEARLRQLARHDPLTGLLNETGLIDAANRRLTGGGHPWMLRVAPQRFGDIRDVFGYAVAEDLLQEFAARLRRALPGRGAEIARIGGHHFAALVEGTSDEDTPSWLLPTIEALCAPMDARGVDLALEVRCGLARRRADAPASAEAMLREADIAWSLARRSHRAWVAFSPRDAERIAERIAMQRRLRGALGRGDLRLALQPILADSPDGRPRPVAIEALLRWRDEVLGEVSPSAFIPVAEEAGLIHALGQFALEAGLSTLARIDAAGHPGLRLCVNVSGEQLQRQDIAQSVVDALDAAGIAPSRLELEVTESVLVEHATMAMDQLEQLASHGVGIAIDDFGTGYSSLSYLQRLPVSTLKVDRSFVDGIAQRRGDYEIARMIVGLAGGLGLRTLAEGVETPEQRAVLAELGVPEFQGFLFSRPLSEADLLAWLEADGGAA